eukprot:7413190-Alexandrium_andersonii.AAC.1
MSASLVGSEMCIRDRCCPAQEGSGRAAQRAPQPRRSARGPSSAGAGSGPGLRRLRAQDPDALR